MEYESDNDYKIGNSKGYLLDLLWRKGIPPKFRSKLWPFAIQNKLEISKKLYRINLKEGLHIVTSIQKKIRQQKKGINKQILEKIQQDIKDTLDLFKQKRRKEGALNELDNKISVSEVEEGKHDVFDLANSVEKNASGENQVDNGEEEFS